MVAGFHSTVVVGFNVSCKSETSPGLDGPQWDLLRISVKYPGYKLVYVDVLLKGDLDGDGPDHGDTNRTIAAKLSRAIWAKVENGELPDHGWTVETSPDPQNPNTAPGRLVFYDAVEVNAASTSGKLKIDIFDPHPPKDKRGRVKVITPPAPPAFPPSVTPPAIPPPKPKGPTTITEPAGQRWPLGAIGTGDSGGYAKRLNDNPLAPPFDPARPTGMNPGSNDKPGYEDPLRAKYGGGGWIPAGFMIIGRPGIVRTDLGFLDPNERVPFRIVHGSASAQARSIASAARAIGLDATANGDEVTFHPSPDPDAATFLGISTGFNPLGIGGPFPWEIALLYDHSIGMASSVVSSPGQPMGRSSSKSAIGLVDTVIRPTIGNGGGCC